MSETVANQGLFRLYAVLWLVGLSLVAMVAHQLAGPSRSTAVIYLAIGAGLWLLNLALAATGRRGPGTEPDGHAAAHAILTAAFALVWPLALAGVVVVFVAVAVNDLRRERQAA